MIQISQVLLDQTYKLLVRHEVSNWGNGEKENYVLLCSINGLCDNTLSIPQL